MSLTSKDMVFGAAGAAAFLGLVVYHQHKFNKLQAEIDELREETRIMAQYIKILESKVAGDFQTILSSHDSHHHHHAHAALPDQSPVQQIQSQQPVQAPAVSQQPPQVAQPVLEDVKPQAPILSDARRAIPAHVRQPVKQAAPPARAQPIKRAAAQPIKRPVVQPARPKPAPVVVPEEPSESEENNSQDEKSESESEKSDDESVSQNSNRRAADKIPPKPSVSQARSTGRPTAPNAGVRSTNQPQRPQHVITVEEGKPPKDKEEAYNPAEDNNKAVEISGGRPTAPKSGGPRVMGPKSGGEKKRFGPKVDESEDSDMMVSSSKVKTKSILKNPSSGKLVESGASIDADLADDMALVASKSAKRDEDNEGREPGQSAARATMAKTAKIAEDMRKKREEREKLRGTAPTGH